MAVAAGEAVLRRRSDGLAVTGELHRHMEAQDWLHLSDQMIESRGPTSEVSALDVDGTVDLHSPDECQLTWSGGTVRAFIAVVERRTNWKAAALGQAALGQAALGGAVPESASRIWLAITTDGITPAPDATPALNPQAMALAAALPHLDDIRAEIRKILASEPDELAELLLRALLGEVDLLRAEIEALIEGPAEPPGWRQRIGDGLRSLGRFGKHVQTAANSVRLGELLVQAAEHAKGLGDEWIP